MLHRHERTCEAKVRYQFPGGTYKTPKTIFDLLEDEGIAIPQHLRFFPYRTTFDFECMFDRDDRPDNSAKLTWEAKHVPLSVSVCSNVPSYDQPRCFVSDGDCKDLVKRMIDYLVEISKESGTLVKEQFSAIFRAIDEKLGEQDNEYNEAELLVDLQEDSEDENNQGIDVMNSDNEDEEEIGSENEEDRAFIDDISDSEEDQDLGFYRAFDQELGGRTEDRRETERKQDKKKEHPLVKLKVIICFIYVYKKIK
jgi:hypothetical protein